MGLVRLTPDEVAAGAVDTLGLDNTIADLATPEVLAAAIRRAASFTCPVTPRVLSRVVEESLHGLLGEASSDSEAASPVRAILDNLVAYGDLLEAPVDDEDRGTTHRTLFLGQPAFVHVSATTCILMGVRAEGLALLDDDLTERVDHDAHVRRLELEAGEDASVLLGSVGLQGIREEEWLRRPPTCAPDVLVAEYELRLNNAGPSGSIDGCRILDTSQPVSYYRGRWRAPTKRDTGHYVARRPLQYGADSWCYAALSSGEVVNLVDLPLRQRLDRACDDAWRLQAALDCLAENPQRVRVAPPGRSGRVVLHLLSPIPSWSQRRLDAVGRPLPKQRGSLISYSLNEGQLEAELSFLAQTMWTQVDEKGATR
jgi:hypothetical protein